MFQLAHGNHLCIPGVGHLISIGEYEWEQQCCLALFNLPNALIFIASAADNVLYTKFIPDLVGPQYAVLVAGFEKRRQCFNLVECFERQVGFLFITAFGVPVGIVVILP